jgi:hypothetical protein
MKKTKKNSIKVKSETLWFKRKLYGWGWAPSTWQGWLVILVWLLIYAFSSSKLDHEWLKNILIMSVDTIALLVICYLKGEKPKWQWGRRKVSSSK